MSSFNACAEFDAQLRLRASSHTDRYQLRRYHKCKKKKNLTGKKTKQKNKQTNK
jgi:hypothetical protein